MNTTITFNPVMLTCIIVLALIVGAIAASLVFAAKVAECDEAVDYVDQLRQDAEARQLEAEDDRLMAVSFLATLPDNPRYMDAAQRVQFAGFIKLVKTWQRDAEIRRHFDTLVLDEV